MLREPIKQYTDQAMKPNCPDIKHHILNNTREKMCLHAANGIRFQYVHGAALTRFVLQTEV